MFRMIIQLNEEKILKERKYQLEDMYLKLDELFYQKQFFKIENEKYSRIYQGSDTYRDFGRMGYIYLMLKQQKWFMDNVSVWRLLESDDSEDPYDFSEEDIIVHCRNKQTAGG